MKFLYIFLICFLITLSPGTIFGQTTKELKYAAAVDVLGMFDNGYPDKVIFKILKSNQNGVQGAWRIGIDAELANMKIEGTQDGNNYELWDEEKRSILMLSLGYEKHNYVKTTNLYYGVDLKSIFNRTNVPEGEAGDSDFFRFNLIPFVGVEIPISKHFSTSIEAGIDNHILINKSNSSDINPDNITKTTWLVSEISLPYTISINYKF